MKERLTKLIKEAQERYIYAEEQAKYLIDNGVDCVKHGEWRGELRKRPDWRGKMQQYFQPNSCSLCHEAVAERTPYCPNCGAKMDGR